MLDPFFILLPIYLPLALIYLVRTEADKPAGTSWKPKLESVISAVFAIYGLHVIFSIIPFWWPNFELGPGRFWQLQLVALILATAVTMVIHCVVYLRRKQRQSKITP